MIASFTEFILDAIRSHGGWSVFLGVMVEQIIVPIPSPVIIMGAGFLLVPAGASWGAAAVDVSLRIVLPGVIASTIGAALLYGVAAWGGKAMVDRFEGWLGFAWKDVESFSARLRGPGAWTSLFFMRALPIVPLSLISIAGGALRLPPGPYLLSSFLGSIPRCYILAFLGWQMGARALDLARGVNHLESLISLAVAGSFIAFVWWLRRRARASISSRNS